MKKKALGYALSIISLSAVCVTAGLQSVEAVSTKTTNGTVTYTDGTLDLDDDDAMLPDSLKFGSHEIQYTQDKTYYATDSGTDNENASAADLTTGTVSVTDNRSSASYGWGVTVQQVTQFNDGTDDLASAVLTILGDPGAITDDQGASKTLSGTSDFSGGKLALTPGNSHDVVGATAADAMAGKGNSRMALDGFTLDVPKDSTKNTGTYTADIVWTVTAAP